MKRNNSEKWKNRLAWTFLGIAGLIFAAALIASVVIWNLNEYSLTVHLHGPEEIVLEYGEDYREPGAWVTRQGTILMQEARETDTPVRVEGSVDPKVLGDYPLCYRAQEGALTAQARRLVRVVDTQAPELVVDENAKIPIFVPGEPYVDNSYRAVDNYDGDLTDQVMVLEKQGQIQYSVTDSSGNTAVVTREVPEYDPIPPRIHLEGEQEVHLLVGRSFAEPGYQADDNGTADLTDRVTVEGEVDRFTPGLYPITYTVSDDYGNQTQVVRNVTVEAAPRPRQKLPQQKTVYLTFDDGPGPYTDKLLDILGRYGVKATFFVVGSGHAAQMKRIVEEGHSIAVHSVTHNYSQIYASKEAYFADILGEQETIRQATGVETTLMRFPGGSSNMVSRFNKGIMTELTQAVQDAGFQYFDWNVDSNDAGGARTAREVRDNVIDGIRNNRVSVVLQHDIHPFSVDAVESILQWGQENGYQFLPLEPDSFGARHGVNN